MGQTESRTQNMGPQDIGSEEDDFWTLGYLSRKQDQETIFRVQGKLPDETEIKISSQTDRIFKWYFIWQQELESFREDRNILVDRSFEMKSKTGETIKIGIILSYDSPSISFKVKIIQGAEFFINMKIPRFGFTHDKRRLFLDGKQCSPNETELLGEEYVKRFNNVNSYFDEIFLSEPNGSNKTFSLDIAFQFQLKEKSSLKIEKLTEKLEKMFVQGNEFSDVKVICDGQIFNCHKIILSCQSEVFKGTYTNFHDKYICNY